MKAITLVHYTEPNKSSIYIKDKYYSVSLGNGITNIFSNKVYLTKYFAYINKNLNISLFEIVDLLGRSYQEYYKVWFYIDNTRLYNSVLINLGTVQKSINMAVNRCGSPNGNNFTFLHLFDAINEIKYCIKILIKIRKKKNQYIEVNNLEIIINRLDNIKSRLSIIGKNWKP